MERTVAQPPKKAALQQVPTWLDLEGVMLSEISQPQDRYA